MAKFEVYQDGSGEYRWRLKVTNGQTIAIGGEGYSSKRSALAGIASVKKNAPDAEVSEGADQPTTKRAKASAPSAAEGAGSLS